MLRARQKRIGIIPGMAIGEQGMTDNISKRRPRQRDCRFLPHFAKAFIRWGGFA
jgi:hypothetical protein